MYLISKLPDTQISFYIFIFLIFRERKYLRFKHLRRVTLSGDCEFFIERSEITRKIKNSCENLLHVDLTASNTTNNAQVLCSQTKIHLKNALQCVRKKITHGIMMMINKKFTESY